MKTEDNHSREQKEPEAAPMKQSKRLVVKTAKSAMSSDVHESKGLLRTLLSNRVLVKTEDGISKGVVVNMQDGIAVKMEDDYSSGKRLELKSLTVDTSQKLKRQTNKSTSPPMQKGIVSSRNEDRNKDF